jgi:hypothetical protein
MAQTYYRKEHTMINNLPNKGDMLIYVDSTTQKAISPNDLLIYVGTVITDEKGNKKVGTATPKTLGVVLSDLTNDLDKAKKELNELTISYRKTIKNLASVVEIQTNKLALQEMELNDLKTKIKNLEEKVNEKK